MCAGYTLPGRNQDVHIEYSEKGFLFTPEKYTGRYESIGIFISFLYRKNFALSAYSIIFIAENYINGLLPLFTNQYERAAGEAF